MPRWKLAAAGNVSESTLERWEAGENTPHPDEVDRIADVPGDPLIWHRWMLSNYDRYRRRYIGSDNYTLPVMAMMLPAGRGRPARDHFGSGWPLHRGVVELPAGAGTADQAPQRGGTAMIRAGEKLIVWDPTVQDMYAAVAVQDEADELAVNPLVRICAVIVYPMQHAAMFPDRVSEHAPLPEGTECRLKLVCLGWLCFEGDYDTTLREARAHMIDSVLTRISRGRGRLDSITDAAARDEYEVLRKHGRGEYAPRTVMGKDVPAVIPQRQSA